MKIYIVGSRLGVTPEGTKDMSIATRTIVVKLPGPVAGMVSMELRRKKIHGGISRLATESIVKNIGWKYPKLLTRHMSKKAGKSD